MKILDCVPEHDSSLIYWENGTIPQKDFTEERVGITMLEAQKFLHNKGGIAYIVYFMKLRPLGLILISPHRVEA